VGDNLSETSPMEMPYTKDAMVKKRGVFVWGGGLGVWLQGLESFSEGDTQKRHLRRKREKPR